MGTFAKQGWAFVGATTAHGMRSRETMRGQIKTARRGVCTSCRASSSTTYLRGSATRG